MTTRIFITGGTGSFGQAFVRHVLAAAKPKRQNTGKKPRKA